MKFDPFRQQYRELSPAEAEFIANFKHEASILWGLMDQSVESGERSERARLMAMAKSYLEISVMLAVKGLTT